VIQSILREQPKVGWSLLIELLPGIHRATSPTYKPKWRNFISQYWQEGTSQKEYWEQINSLGNLIVENAKCDVERIASIIEHLHHLPKSAIGSIKDYISSEVIHDLSEEDRFQIWDRLRELVAEHRSYSDAQWALPDEILQDLDELVHTLEPDSPFYKYQNLFNPRSWLFERHVDYHEQYDHITQKRQEAVEEILSIGNVDMCLVFARQVELSFEVGLALGQVTTDETERSLFPMILESGDCKEHMVAAGFVAGRLHKRGIDWLKAVMGKDWSMKHKAKFLQLVRFEQTIADQIPEWLGENNEELFWKNVQVDRFAIEGHHTTSIMKLIQYGRADSAAMCLATQVLLKKPIDELLAVQTLIAIVNDESDTKELDKYLTLELIQYLQQCEAVDKDALFSIEWYFLPWLDEHSSIRPITLEKTLASNPDFFVHVLSVVFRSEKDDNTKTMDERDIRIAENAYMLLRTWKLCPGVRPDGIFIPDVFNKWITEAIELAESAGYGKIAQYKIGEVLTCAPSDPSGLWVHEAVALVLDQRHNDEMRSGFFTEMINRRGAYWASKGHEERELAQKYQDKAQSLDERGFHRFASIMRKLSNYYEMEAVREAHEDYYS